MMSGPEMNDGGLEAAIKGVTSENHSSNDNVIICQSQALPPFTPSQKRLLDMCVHDLLTECQEAKDAGWSGRYVKQKVWAAFWHCAEQPEVHALLGRLDEAVVAVFGAEPVIEFDTRREYWADKKHPNPELAAANEVNGITLANDLHKQAAHARGDVPAVPDSRLIAHRCLQIARQLATKGKHADEPSWFGALRVLAHCEPDLTREISCGHAKFTESEYNEKLQRIKDDELKPVTCNYFHTANPKGCVGCTFIDLRSPISLGYENLPRPKRGAL